MFATPPRLAPLMVLLVVASVRLRNSRRFLRMAPPLTDVLLSLVHPANKFLGTSGEWVAVSSRLVALLGSTGSDCIDESDDKEEEEEDEDDEDGMLLLRSPNDESGNEREEEEQETVEEEDVDDDKTVSSLRSIRPGNDEPGNGSDPKDDGEENSKEPQDDADDDVSLLSRSNKLLDMIVARAVGVRTRKSNRSHKTSALSHKDHTHSECSPSQQQAHYQMQKHHEVCEIKTHPDSSHPALMLVFYTIRRAYSRNKTKNYRHKTSDVGIVDAVLTYGLSFRRSEVRCHDKAPASDDMSQLDAQDSRRSHVSPYNNNNNSTPHYSFHQRPLVVTAGDIGPSQSSRMLVAPLSQSVSSTLATQQPSL